MTRHQAQAAQIEQARQSLVEASGEEAVAAIEGYLNCCLQLRDYHMASVEWFYSPSHSDAQAYAYGKMVIAAHFERSKLK